LIAVSYTTTGSELIFDPELNHAGFIGCGDDATARRSDCRSRLAEADDVEQIECFDPELDPRPARNVEVLEQRLVRAREAGSRMMSWPSFPDWSAVCASVSRWKRAVSKYCDTRCDAFALGSQVTLGRFVSFWSICTLSDRRERKPGLRLDNGIELPATGDGAHEGAALRQIHSNADRSRTAPTP
jgi:hypothetical protein